MGGVETAGCRWPRNRPPHPAPGPHPAPIYLNAPIASLTSSSVASASAFARSLPARSTDRTYVRSFAYSARRARKGPGGC